MTIKCYQLKPGGKTSLAIPASTLDEMTRALPPGFYTTLAGGTRVLGLKTHLQRLYLPAHELGLRPSMDEAALRQRIAEVVKQNLPGESRLRLILARERGDIYVCVEPFKPLPGAVYENGVHVITAEMTRRDPRIKDTRFILQSAEQRKQVSGDVYEVLLTKNGKIFEGLTSNFYAAGQIDNLPRIITARYGILPGVTRRIVLRLARGQGIHIEYRAPRVDEDFDEAFLTSSSRGVVPVVGMDDKLVGRGRVGEVTKRLSEAYKAFLQEHAERI